MKKLTALTHPYLVLIDNLKCPTPECTNHFTYEFNLLRIATFNIAQRRYSEMQRKVDNIRPSMIEAKTLESLKKYNNGEIVETFDFKCPSCKARHVFKVNALTGDVTDTQGNVILQTPPKPVAVALA